MNFQLVSDLHIEMKGGIHAPASVYPTATTEMLVVAGDTYNMGAPEFPEILKRISEPFRLTLFVPGNHDWYGMRADMATSNAYAARICNSVPNVLYLNKTSVTIGGVLFVGATMWTDIPKSKWADATSMLNDFKFINSTKHSVGLMTPEEVVDMHADQRRWMSSTINRAKKSEGMRGAVVITHHAPDIRLSVETESKPRVTFPFYFSTDLGSLVGDPFVKVWCYGHTHESKVVRLDPWGPFFCTNGLGYKNESTGYINPAVIKLSSDY